jgi:putative acetyltransferase
MAAFEPARRLYALHGFTECGPFADYILDPNSVFMTIELISTEV